MLALALGAALPGLGSGAAHAQVELPEWSGRSGEPVEVRAHQLSLDQKQKLYEAQGDVQLRQGDRELRADWIVFHSETGRGVASGRVRLKQGRDVLTASFLQFDADDLEGVVYEGQLDAAETGFQMRGRAIARTGDETYHFEDGVFTTCICPDPEERKPWQIEAGEADLEIGGYGTARNTTFDILEVPVLWFPWMIFPLKTERQSGVLLPDLTYSRRNGVELGQPIFLALGDPVNLTLTPRWLQLRGVKGDAELEYVVGERSSGELFGSFLSDQEIEPYSAGEPYARERWALAGVQDWWLPGGLRAKADFAFVSDNDYLFDFRDLHDRSRERFLESQAFLTRHFGEQDQVGAVLSAVYADDLQSLDDQDRDRFLLQRLPRFELAVLPEPTDVPGLRWLTHSFDLEYTMFRPRGRPNFGLLPLDHGTFFDTGIDGIPDSEECGVNLVCTPSADKHRDNLPGTEGDRLFQEGEALADRGHRLELWPRVSVPLRLFDRIELLPEIGWRETLYATDAQRSALRGLLTGHVDLRTRLRGKLAGMDHVVEPRVGYAVVRPTGQSDNPLFVPKTAAPQLRLRETELWNRLADPADRVDAFHGISYGVNQRFYRRKAAGQLPELLADLLISNEYDAEGDGIGPVYLDGHLFPLPETSVRLQLGVDPLHSGPGDSDEKVRISEGLVQAGWHSPRGHALTLEYRYLRDIPTFFEDFQALGERFDGFKRLDHVNQVTGNLQWALSARWTLRYSAIYSFDEGLLLGHYGSIEYFSRCECWGAGIEVGDNRTRGVRFNLIRYIGGFGRENARFRRLLDDR